MSHKAAVIISFCLIFLVLAPSKANSNSFIQSSKYIGHRGLAGCAPENTMPAFSLAASCSLAAVECDIQLSSDGEFVVIHDDTLERTTNGSGKVRNFTLKALRRLQVDNGSNISNYKKIRLPRLREFLSLCRKRNESAIIDIKFHCSTAIATALLKEVKKYGNLSKTTLVSTSAATLKNIRQLSDSIGLGVICQEISNAVVSFAQSQDIYFINCYYSSITGQQIELCHKNKLSVGAWTVDSYDTAQYLLSLGTDFITTNYMLPGAIN